MTSRADDERSGRRRPALVAALVGAALLVGGAVAGGAVLQARHSAHRPSASPVTGADPTTAPPPATTAPTDTSATTAPAPPDLSAELPTAFAATCTTSATSALLDHRAAGQVVCTGRAVPDADVVLYLGYPQATTADDEYATALVAGNGVQPDSGHCDSLDLVAGAGGSASCEGTVAPGGHTTAGHQVVLQGSDVALGQGSSATALCAGVTGGLTVIGFVNDPTASVGLAISCSTDPSTVGAMEHDLLAGAYDLAAPPPG